MLARSPGSPYLQSEWPSTQGHPAPRANFAISHTNSSQLFINKRIKNSLARGGSVWRVTLLPGTTLLHINRPWVPHGAFQNHAHSAMLTITFFASVNQNYDDNQRTVKKKETKIETEDDWRQRKMQPSVQSSHSKKANRSKSFQSRLEIKESMTTSPQVHAPKGLASFSLSSFLHLKRCWNGHFYC